MISLKLAFVTATEASLTEYGHEIEEKVKAMQSEIKDNVQGTNMKGRKLGLKSTIWSRRRK